MEDGESFGTHRSKLNEKLAELYERWKNMNKSRKVRQISFQSIGSMTDSSGLSPQGNSDGRWPKITGKLIIGGAGLGAALGWLYAGVPGAVVGCLVGAVATAVLPYHAPKVVPFKNLD